MTSVSYYCEGNMDGRIILYFVIRKVVLGRNNVPFQQTTDLVQKLRAKGDVYFELMILPDEPDVFLLYKNRIACYNRAFEFIDRL